MKRWVRELKNIAALTASVFTYQPEAKKMQLAVILGRAPRLRRASFDHYVLVEAQFMDRFGAREPRQPEGII